MEFDIEDLARRLVVGHKRDGRGVYDPIAKRELVEVCRRPGVSVAKLARECGINANLLATWLRKRERSLAEVVDVGVGSKTAAFIAVPMAPIQREPVVPIGAAPTMMTLQARLPNGVSLELQGTDAQHIATFIETLGRLRCSASTKG
ncbi:MAG: transposase [Burkholderiales bacterium]|nr:transposase [Burkholderiales bacterium]